MKEELEEILKSEQNLLKALIKWIVLSVLVGGVVGVIASGFAHVISIVTEFRIGHPFMVLGLPIGGMLVVYLYQLGGQTKNSGTNMVLDTVRTPRGEMPTVITPLILVATTITHMFGGSSGREGAALQFGASMGSFLGRTLKLNESDRKIVMLSGMSAAFAALFGTPMAAAIFPMEVISVGVVYYSALVPCVFSAFIGEYVSVLLKVRTLKIPYLIEEVPSFYSVNCLKAILLAVLFAAAGILFCVLLHKSVDVFGKWFPNPYLRVAVGGIAVILLALILHTSDYLGLGEAILKDSFVNAQNPERFLMKMIFTCLTLSSGFKGGEIVPSLFIGATLGSALSSILALPANLCAGCGMVGVFCAVTNCPVSSMLIAAELFGFTGMPYYCVVIAVSYLISGYKSLYHAQTIVYSKTENKYVNRHTD